MIKVSGDYVTLRDLTIQNTKGAGCFLWGNYDYGINLYLSHTGHTGLLVSGIGDVLDGCTVTGNGWRSQPPYNDPTWGSAICTTGTNCIIQNCISHDNIGEGINSYNGASGSIIQDNIAYDNLAINYYLDSTVNTTVRRNIGFYYSTPVATRNFNLYVGAETGQPNNLTVLNNFMIGGRTNFVIGGNVTGSPLVTIAYNTFVNAVDAGGGWNMGVYFRPTSYGAGSIFKNNLVIQEDPSTVCAAVPSTHTNLTFSYNGWSKTPDLDASGTGDVICSGGNCKLAKTGSITPDGLTAEYFKILADSSVIDKGSVIAGITTDYFGTTRPEGSAPDMGGHEYVGSADTTPPSAPSGVTIL